MFSRLRRSPTPDSPGQTPSANRFRVALRVLGFSLSVGLVAGLLLGWAHVLPPALDYLAMMGWQEWLDALTFSGLAHLLLYTTQALVLGLLAAVCVLISSHVRLGIHIGAFATAILVAGLSVLWFWVWAINGHVDAAMDPAAGWWTLLAVVWLAVALAVYVLAWAIADTRPARLAGRFVKRMTLPALVVGIVCLVVQVAMRPQARSDAPAWPPEQTAEPSDAKAPPNVVLVILDTLRADRLGCYGYDRKTSPRLDAFAADAVVFEQCISPGIWTLPSHTSMFTGLYPSEHGATWEHLWVDNQFTTLPELLKRAGYQTVALSNNPYVGSVTNLARGYDGFLLPIMLHSVRANVIGAIVNGPLYTSGMVGTWLGVLTAADDGARVTNRLARRFLDQRNADKPFFLFINYMEPHAPYVPHMPYKRRYVDPDMIDMSFRCVWWVRRPEYSLLKRDVFAPEQMTLLNNVYDAEVRQLDDFLGDLLETLARRVDLDRTLVIITSDHGENLGEHHIIGHAWCVDDTIAHVPLIVRYPQRLEPGRREDPVQTLDVYATVLDAVQGSPPKDARWSRSLLSTTTTRPTATATASKPPTTSSPASTPNERLIITEYLAGHAPALDAAQKLDNRFNRTPYNRPIRSIREGPWKLVVHDVTGRTLYDLKTDPGELNDVLDKNPNIARRLADRLEAWQQSITPYRAKQALEGSRQMDQGLQSRLRDLGYVQ